MYFLKGGRNSCFWNFKTFKSGVFEKFKVAIYCKECVEFTNNIGNLLTHVVARL